MRRALRVILLLTPLLAALCYFSYSAYAGRFLRHVVTIEISNQSNVELRNLRLDVRIDSGPERELQINSIKPAGMHELEARGSDVILGEVRYDQDGAAQRHPINVNLCPGERLRISIRDNGNPTLDYLH